MTIGAVAAAALISVGAIIARRRIARRLTETVDESSELDLVVSDLTSAGALSAAVMVLGLVACLMPATPLIVPLAFVVVTGAVPTLVVLGTDARRRQRDGALIVWTPRPTRAVKAPPLERRQ
jgi:ABC-type spermidine/putrescine transport system permease subunit II